MMDMGEVGHLPDSDFPQQIGKGTKFDVTLLNYPSLQEEVKNTNVIVVKGILIFSAEETKIDNITMKMSIPLSKILRIRQNCLSEPKTLNYTENEWAFVFVAQLTPGENQFDFVNISDDLVIRSAVFDYVPHPISAVRFGVVPIIVCPHGTNTEAAICTSYKIILGLRLVQAFYEEKMYEHGFGRKSFYIMDSEVKILKLTMAKSTMTQMKAENLWDIVACEIKESSEIWNPERKYVAFVLDSLINGIHTSSSFALPDSLAWGGGGLALIGFNTFDVWPLMTDHVIPFVFCDESLENDNSDLLPISRVICRGIPGSGLNKSKGNLFCASIGALAHEIGHIFDLGHTEIGIMGKGFVQFARFFRHVFLTPSNDNLKAPVSISPAPTSLLFHQANILGFHKFFSFTFSEHEELSKNVSPQLKGNKITSVIPLKTVEIRELTTGLVLRNFEIGQKDSTVTLFNQDIPIEYTTKEVLIFAQDEEGNILKTSLFKENLPNGFTRIHRP